MRHRGRDLRPASPSRPCVVLLPVGASMPRSRFASFQRSRAVSDRLRVIAVEQKTIRS